MHLVIGVAVDDGQVPAKDIKRTAKVSLTTKVGRKPK